MADSFTDNRNIIQPLVGSDSGTWGGLLNSAAFAQLDLVLGATQAITITAADVTLTLAQWNNCAINLSGALTGNRSLILPFNGNSVSVAVGGLFVVDNETTGAYNVTVKTQASGSTGVTVPQGLRTWLYSDTVNVWYADDSSLKVQHYAGNPNGNVAGVAASVNNPPSILWDYTNFIIWVCTTTGTSSTAVWTNSAQASTTLTSPQGYLTPVSNIPIITSDSLAATAIYYTPFTGAQVPIHNGSLIVPYTFAQLPLTLSASQAANNIYDVFLAYNSGTPVIGTGPSWSAGSGGSVTPGSCARGTGAGSTDLSRATPSGFWVNTNSMSLIYNTGSGNNTITVSAGQGVYLGSIYIDGTGGQVTCTRSYGQSRKWGIWNCYNRTPIILQGGDPTASWGYSTATWRQSNGSSGNTLFVFSGLAEEEYNASFSQQVLAETSGTTVILNNGIGWNVTNAPSGTIGTVGITNATASAIYNYGNATASYTAAPALGINAINALEIDSTGANGTWYGTQTYFRLQATWRG